MCGWVLSSPRLWKSGSYLDHIKDINQPTRPALGTEFLTEQPKQICHHPWSESLPTLCRNLRLFFRLGKVLSPGRVTIWLPYLFLCQADTLPSPSLSRFSSQSWRTPSSWKTLLPLHFHPSQSISGPFWSLSFWEGSHCIYFYLSCQ